MKKLLLVLALGLLFSPAADAYQCVKSQALDKSDQCTAYVRVAADETTLVSIGHVLVHDLSEGTVNGITFQTELSDASADDTLIAGIAQGSVTSGSLAQVVVRGKTKVRLATGNVVSSGDALYVSATEGNVGHTGDGSPPIGFALEASSGGENIDAYITIV